MFRQKQGGKTLSDGYGFIHRPGRPFTQDQHAADDAFELGFLLRFRREVAEVRRRRAKKSPKYVSLAESRKRFRDRGESHFR
jgi:hypothetical protein